MGFGRSTRWSSASPLVLLPRWYFLVASWFKQFVAGPVGSAVAVVPGAGALLNPVLQHRTSLNYQLLLWLPLWTSWWGSGPLLRVGSFPPPFLGLPGGFQPREVNGGHPLHRLTPLSSPPLVRLAGVWSLDAAE